MKRRLLIAGGLAILGLVAAACQPTPYDFTGDHVADYGWMDGAGSYYIVGDPNPIFTPGTIVAADNPWAVPGDWDGDSKTEPAVASAETGVWETPDGTFTYAPADLDPTFDPTDLIEGGQWIPVPANWDKTDKAWEPAWYREDDATWFIQGQAPIQFGTGANGWRAPPPNPFVIDDMSFDVPVPLDFDNDGEADIAVYRPLDGTFRTLDGGVIATLGLGYPAPADYLGDRAPEPAIYDIIDGQWLIDGAAPISQPNPIPSGNAMPASADFDGDKKADPTLFDYDTAVYELLGGGTVSTGAAWSETPNGRAPWMGASLLRITFLQQACEQTPVDCPSGVSPPWSARADVDLDGMSDVGHYADGAFYQGTGPTTSALIWQSQVVSANPKLPVAGDYDGDNRWAAAIVVDGIWETADAGNIIWDPEALEPGANHDDWIPVPGNYDNTDPAWEPAWYRESDATWFIQGQAPIQFGTGSGGVNIDDIPTPTADALAYDVPVPADYDGDGDTDIAVYRPLDGTFRTLDAGVIATLDLGYPAPGNYDLPETNEEPAVYSPWASGWYNTTGTFWPATPPFTDGVPATGKFDYVGPPDDPLEEWVALWSPGTGQILMEGATNPGTYSPGAGYEALTTPFWQTYNRARLTYLGSQCYEQAAGQANCPSGITPPP